MRCYPLTITDAHRCFLLRCQALPSTETARVQPLCAATFREYGLPDVLRTDNGPPFASVGLAGRTALRVWWIKLGILPERIRPGKPSENGQRMHRTLKAAACVPSAAILRAQQAAGDRFRHEYNTIRPHAALGQCPPATVLSARAPPGPPPAGGADLSSGGCGALGAAERHHSLAAGGALPHRHPQW